MVLPLAVLRNAWQRLGLAGVLESIPADRDRQLIQAMIFGRLLFPCAKLGGGLHHPSILEPTTFIVDRSSAAAGTATAFFLSRAWPFGIR